MLVKNAMILAAKRAHFIKTQQIFEAEKNTMRVGAAWKVNLSLLEAYRTQVVNEIFGFICLKDYIWMKFIKFYINNIKSSSSFI